MLSGVMLLAASSYASDPVIRQMQSGVILSALSDNGRWALSSETGEVEEGGVFDAGGKIWNVSSLTSTDVPMPDSGLAGVYDITDDGEIVVGECDGVPAYLKVSTGEWHKLTMPSGAISGLIRSVTPDGTRAVGYVNMKSEWDAIPVLYDLTTGSLIELKNVPTINMNHEVSDYSAFCGISADGRYVLGRLSQEVLTPISMCAYVYDTATDQVNYIGFTPSATRPWTPSYSYLLFIDSAEMSPNGRYVTGSGHIGRAADGSDWLDEYDVAYRYDVMTGTTDIYDGVYDADISGFSVTNSGTVLAATPAVNSYSSMLVRDGNYYYALDDIFSQVYGMDFYQKTGLDNTGKPILCSNDGRIVAVLTSQTDSYILEMPEEWTSITPKVNLLNSFTANPPRGAVFSTLSQLSVSFNRNVELSGSASRIKLLDENGSEVRSAAKAEVSANTVTINFRSVTFEPGKKYTVVIPAGHITMVGDMNVAAGEIRIDYVGRESGSVTPVAITPADGSSFARLDATTNPISIAFNASLKIADGAKAELWRADESAAYATLDLTLFDSTTLLVYPISRQYLYEGTDYKVIIPAGTVTDLGGEGGNEEITLNYKGTYVREISADDKYLFTDDCSTYANFMFYDGDRLAPGSVPAGWGFTADNPWFIVASTSGSTDMAYAAHSMFANGGKADDWCVIPQIYIPDTQCYVSFDAQSYKKDKTDRLKMYVYESDNVYSSLNSTIIEEIRTKGDLLFDEQLTPGETEEELDDDWMTYNVMLNAYAGKNIYIAFVNDNENQSAVFINNIDVIHDMKFLTTVTSKDAVIKKDSAPVAGSITIASDLLTAETIDLQLLDSSNKKISEVSLSGLNLTNGKSVNFTFPDELPLQYNVANRFTIGVTVNGTETASVSSSIKNLAFEPTRRVVIEEYSGRECSNCPQGFAAMDNLERMFPEQIIPIVLRTYQNDPLGQGMTTYTEFLGLQNVGAPSAVINRKLTSYPMVRVGNDYRFTGEGVSTDGENESVCWLDAVVREMQTYADADLDFEAVYDKGTGRISVNGNARWALNSDNTNINILAVVTEDNLTTIQLNGMYTVSDPDLGEWGANGAYGTRFPTVPINGVGRGVSGRTFNGTSGLIPSSISAGVDCPLELTISMPETVADPVNANVVLMMIDGDNDNVVNANIARVSIVNAIESVESDNDSLSPIEYYDLQGRLITSPKKGALVIKRQGKTVKKVII